MIYGLAILVFLRPFICSPAFPGINFYYAAALIVFLMIWAIVKRPPLPEKNITLAITLFIGTLTASLLLSGPLVPAAQTLSQYACGILLFLICRALPHDHADKVLKTILTAGVVISVIGIYQFFFDFQNTLNYLHAHRINDPLVTQFIQQQRVFSLLITPNTLGGYLVMLLPLALFVRNKIWVLPLAAALLLTKSIGAFMTLLLFFPFYAYQRRLFNPLVFGSFAAVILMGIGITFWRSQTHAINFNPGYSIDMRWHYWEETWVLIRTNPVTGAGLGHLNLPAARYTHNLYLQLWAETGLAGILSFLYLIMSILRAAWKTMATSPDQERATALFFAAIIFLLHNMVDFTFFLPEVSLVWCVILGLACNRSARIGVSATPA